MFTTNSRLPFGVRAHESDPTLAFSTPAENGDLAGRTGVIFTPPIQSGEHLKLEVFFDPKPILGVDAPGKLDIAQTSLRQLSPSFQTWHAVNLVLHAGKRQTDSAATSPFSDFSSVQEYFDPAYLVLRRLKVARRAHLDELGNYDETIRDAFDELLTGHVAGPLATTGEPPWIVDPEDRRPAPVSPKPGRESFLIKDHIFDVAFSPSAVSAAMRVRRPIDVIERYRKHAKLPASMDPRAVARHLWAPENGDVNDRAHGKLVSHAAAWVTALAGTKLTPASEGLRITEVVTLAEDGTKKVYDDEVGGMAFTDNRRTGHVLVVRNFDLPSKTLAHEVGHECFLPHRVGAHGDPKAHDPADDRCLMHSFARRHTSVAAVFCAFEAGA